jgi:hypothetical protein
MKKTNTNANAIVFAQAKDNSKLVTANKYVAHALYTQNKALVESLGGTVLKGVGGFQAEFKTVANAKKFVATAITHIDAEDYAKARKTEPKTKAKAEPKPKKVAPTTAKGKADDLVTVTLTDGTKAQVKASAFGITEPKKAPRKSKGDAPTTAPNAKASKSVKAKAEPKKSKGNCKVDFSKLAGKGRSANKDAAALMRKAGLVDGTSAEYKAVWAEWCKVR